MAFNPTTERLYFSMLEETAIYQLNKDLPVYKAGERYVGVTNTTKDRDTSKPWGYWGAVLPMTGKPAWRTPLMDLPSWSGAMVTAGGLVFTGNTAGDFAALDEATGKILWQFKTPSGVNSQPVTYKREAIRLRLSGWARKHGRRETAGKCASRTVWTLTED